MSAFKDMVSTDIHSIFLNTDEFAEKRTVLYDGNAYANIPLVLSQIKEKDRHQSGSDHAQGLYMVQYTMHAALDDLGGVLPEKGMHIRINDREIGRPQPVPYDQYFHYLRYADIDYAKGTEYFKRYKPSLGGCSVVSRGNIVGRNYDWNFDENASFVVRTEAVNGRHGVIGVARGTNKLTDEFVRSKADADDYDIVPFFLLDGINDAGLFCEINVCPTGDLGLTHGTNPAGEDLCAILIPRFVLDYASSVDEAIELLRGRNIYAANSSAMCQEFHFLLKDKTKTVVIEFVRNEMVVIDTFVDDAEIMTNFYLHGFDGTRQSLTAYAMGIERYDLLKSGYDTATTILRMKELMKTAWYSKAYDLTLPALWYSEFCGNFGERYGDLTKNSDPEEYMPLMEHCAELFAERVRDGRTWQTVHTSVYDIAAKSLSVIPQEGDKAYAFSLEDGGIAEDRSAGFFRDFYIVTSGIEMGMVRLELEAIDE